MRLSLLLLISSATLIVALENGRSSKQFWMGFERGISQARAEVQKTLEDNLMTAMGRVAHLGKKIGSLSGRYEDESPRVVEGPLSGPQESISPEDAPIEAIEGKLGYDGMDDGLKVYFEGDSEQEEIPDPHIIPSDRNSFVEASDDDEVVPPPRTGGPLFDLRFGFPYRFPFAFGHDRGPTVFFQQKNQWWKGENVCVEITEEDETPQQLEEEVEEILEEEEDGGRPAEEGRTLFFGHLTLQSCSEKPDKYTCVTKIRRNGVNRSTKKVYRCCHGFVKDDSGCSRVEVEPLSESLEHLGLRNFLSLAVTSRTLEEFEKMNMTLFVPSDEALLDFMSVNQTESNDIHDLGHNSVTSFDETYLHEMQKTMNLHAHEGFLYSGDFKDEEVITSLTPESSLRLNVYPQTLPPLLTVNCAPIIKTDHHYAKGVIHTLDRVIEPASRTMAEIIQNDPDLTHFRRLLTESGYIDQLSSPGQYTLLAPNDAAFGDVSTVEDILSSSSCSPAIAANHILPNTICATAMTSTSQARTKNLLDNYLSVKYHKSGNIYFEDALVVRKDIISSNGVIHVIDKVLIPKEGSPASMVLESMNHTKFLDLVKEFGLESELNKPNITILVPTNEAIQEHMDNNVNNTEKHFEHLQALVANHFIQEPFDPKHSFNNHIMQTAAGHPMRVNYFRGPPILTFSEMLRGGPSSLMRVTASCVPLTNEETEVCGGTRVRVVDQVVKPVKKKILHTLESEPNLSIFRDLVMKTSLANTLTSEGPFTILAPSDAVFKTLPEAEFEELMKDDELALSLIRRHTLNDFVCCSGIAPHSLFSSNKKSFNLSGKPITFHRTSHGRLMAGPARITKCLRPNLNGIIHVVDRLFIEPHVPEVRFHWNEESPTVMRVNLFKP